MLLFEQRKSTRLERLWLRRSPEAAQGWGIDARTIKNAFGRYGASVVNASDLVLQGGLAVGGDRRVEDGNGDGEYGC